MRRTHLAYLSFTLLLAACAEVATNPETELGLQAQPATRQVEASAKNMINDARASGGKAALLSKQGDTATFELNEVPSGRYKVSVRARADEYRGYPVMRMYHSGERLGKDNPVSREQYGEGTQKFGEAELEQGDTLRSRVHQRPLRR